MCHLVSSTVVIPQVGLLCRGLGARAEAGCHPLSHERSSLWRVLSDGHKSMTQCAPFKRTWSGGRNPSPNVHQPSLRAPSSKPCQDLRHPLWSPAEVDEPFTPGFGSDIELYATHTPEGCENTDSTHHWDLWEEWGESGGPSSGSGMARESQGRTLAWLFLPLEGRLGQVPLYPPGLNLLLVQRRLSYQFAQTEGARGVGSEA